MNDLIYSYSQQFHILRHFKKIDEGYRKVLKSLTDYSDEEINDQLAIVGSKFYPEFVQNPIQLMKKIKAHQNFKTQDIIKNKGDRNVINLLFSKEDYPKGIANDSLFLIDELPSENKKQVQIKERDGFLINHIKVKISKPSWQLNIVLAMNGKPTVITIFPGIEAPSFPNSKTQGISGFKESKCFWEQHAFII